MIKLSDTSVFAIVRADLIEHRRTIECENNAKHCFKVEREAFNTTSSLKIEQQNELTNLVNSSPKGEGEITLILDKQKTALKNAGVY